MKHSALRWLILAAGIVANLCQGVAYTSSIFMLPLGERLGRPSAVWASEWGVIFAMALAFLPAGMLISGKLADLGYTRFTAGVGAVLFGAGLVLAGYGTTVPWIAVTLGMMTSLGAGCAYGTVIGAMVRWFPDRRGLASGMAVAAVGLGPIVLAPAANVLTAAYGVMNMFKILGVVCFVLMGIAALCVKNPPAGYAPGGWTPPANAPRAAEGLNWKQMLARPLFYLLFAAYFCGVFAGVLVNGLAAPIAVELAGFTRDGATWAVMLFALASTGGRVLWGQLSDKFGRVFMIGVAFVLTVASMLMLYRFVAVPGYFPPCLFVAGLCYGGVFGTFPSLSADFFGTKNAAVNLAVLFLSFSIVAVLAPQVVAFFRAGGPEEYPKAFLVAGCIAAAGLLLSVVIAKRAANKA